MKRLQFTETIQVYSTEFSRSLKEFIDELLLVESTFQNHKDFHVNIEKESDYDGNTCGINFFITGIKEESDADFAERQRREARRKQERKKTRT